MRGRFNSILHQAEVRSAELRPWLYGLCQVGGIAVHGIGASAFLGRMLNNPTLFFGTSDVGIARGTAFCLAIMGIVVTFLAMRLGIVERRLGRLMEDAFETD